jgi:hypothetical protein
VIEVAVAGEGARIDIDTADQLAIVRQQAGDATSGATTR